MSILKNQQKCKTTNRFLTAKLNPKFIIFNPLMPGGNKKVTHT